jgi:hypothetical protein
MAGFLYRLAAVLVSQPAQSSSELVGKTAAHLEIFSSSSSEPVPRAAA